MTYGPTTPYAHIRDNPAAMSVLLSHVPGIVDETGASLPAWVGRSARARFSSKGSACLCPVLRPQVPTLLGVRGRGSESGSLLKCFKKVSSALLTRPRNTFYLRA
jgi:hypothetical protein